MNSWRLIICPQCRAAGGHRLAFGPRNLAAILGNVILLALTLILSGPAVFIGLKRRCMACGHAFVDKHAEKPDFNRCADCEYDLTGNVSGRCPECGWRLPLRYRAHRRRVDRGVSRRSRSAER
ncbi:MAG: hypothetical protein IT449_06490 [Phycisphaerales bacterium]|nr:hypothetical protein [Phycisphaerales bacterium]